MTVAVLAVMSNTRTSNGAGITSVGHEKWGNDDGMMSIWNVPGYKIG